MEYSQPPNNYEDVLLSVVAGLNNKNITNYNTIESEILREISYEFHEPTKEEFDEFALKDEDIFLKEAERRFGILLNYIEDKYKVDKFAIEGNLKLVEKGLEPYLQEKKEELTKRNEINIVDMGPAGGCITSLFVLHSLHKYGLLSRVNLTLIDCSNEVLNECGNWDSKSLPLGFVKEYLQDMPADITGVIRNAEIIQADITSLSAEHANKYDIVVSGFTHHHLNLKGKENVTGTMSNICKQGGFIGLVDESMNYEQYIDWYKKSRDKHIVLDKPNQKQRQIIVPIAQESFISQEDHLSLFGNRISNKRKGKNNVYYWFCGEKV